MPFDAVDPLAVNPAGPVGSRPAPKVARIARPPIGVVDTISPLRQRRSAAVFEIVDALLLHEGVADAAEVDPNMRILVTEQRLELQMFLAVITAPMLFELRRPALVPGILADSVRR